MPYPVDRPRRLRRTDAVRALVRETDVLPRHLIQPFFIEDGEGLRKPISTLEGQCRWSPDTIGDVARECRDLGVPAIILFGIPARKDAVGSEAWNPDGVVQRAVRAVRDAAPGLVVMCDLCACEYTSHGQCGVFEHGEVQNDPTLELYVKTALSYAEAGADFVAPSGMMDGTVSALRTALDDAGHASVAILSYAVKYASAFYGPFREAADSAPQDGDRRGYQMDPGNSREGMREAALDELEGADMLMVKPAGPYLDVITRLRERTDLPLAAYQVSGEYASIRHAGASHLLDGDAAMLEAVRGIRRAGADIVLTYAAMDLARAHRDHGTT